VAREYPGDSVLDRAAAVLGHGRLLPAGFAFLADGFEKESVEKGRELMLMERGHIASSGPILLPMQFLILRRAVVSYRYPVSLKIGPSHGTTSGRPL